MRLPELIAHADWSANPARPDRSPLQDEPASDTPHRRRARSAHWTNCYLHYSPRPGPGGTALLGVDFPIGLPSAYAAKAGIDNFRIALTQFGRGRWRDFYNPAATVSEIALTRPFYPTRNGPKGSIHRADLPLALGFDSYDALHRRCDRAHPDRKAAAVLFWTLGGNQVGKAAISGWRDVIAPALRPPKRGTWASAVVAVRRTAGDLARPTRHSRRRDLSRRNLRPSWPWNLRSTTLQAAGRQIVAAKRRFWLALRIVSVSTSPMLSRL